MKRVTCRCEDCGRAFPIDELDAKPRLDPVLFLVWVALGWRRMIWWAADHGYDFDRLECAACYGPGYVALKASHHG